MKFFVYYYNDSNLGDDLFLDVLLRRYPEHQFYIKNSEDVPKLNPTLSVAPNLFVVESIFYLRTIKAQASRYDGVVMIGGSLFQDLSYSFYRGFVSRILFFRQLQQLGKKVYVIGSNLGPFNTLLGRFLFKNTLKYVNYICVRDKYSFDLLNQWSLSYKSKLAPDIIFSYDYQPIVKVASAKNILGISILNTKLNPEIQSAYINKMIELINEYLKINDNNQVRLFGFDSGHENDSIVIDLILEKIIDKAKVMKIEYNSKIMIANYLELFLECGFIVANRFHSMVLAAKYNIPFFPIVYSKKTSNVLDDIRYPYSSLKYANIAEFNIEELIFEIESNKRNFILPKHVSQHALNHFYGLDSII